MTTFTYPPQLEVAPLTNPPSATVTVPGSKSITNRALVLAALSSRGCRVTNVLRSEDTEVMVECLGRLGFVLTADWDRGEVAIAPDVHGDRIPAARADLFVGNSGTTIRFLTAMLALGNGTYRLDGIPRMRERPIGDLLDALRQFGVDARSEANTGCPPVVVTTTGLRGGHARVKADVSSQYLSGLLLAAPFADGDVVVEIDGPRVSEPYIEMTLAMMRAFGLTIVADGPNRYRVPGRQSHAVRSYAVEPDASSASYFLAAAAITGGTVGVRGLTADSLQGDVRFLDVLEEMGRTAARDADALAVTGGPLRGVDVDMNAISDTVMTLAAVACFADGPTTIRNVAHIRHKETDRIAALATELRKLGAGVEEFADGLTITPPKAFTPCAVDTYNDHRMAMSLALVGLRVPGVIINNPGCVAKTYPGFWQDLEKLRT